MGNVVDFPLRRNAARERRVILFLQGPQSPFFERLAEGLILRGHEVRKINICAGDHLFWRRRPATSFRGRLESWPEFIDAYLEKEGITDLVFLGDRRPHHVIAGDKARARGVQVLACELGYMRPDWITLERNGMSSRSHFPVDPEQIAKIAHKVPAPDLVPRFSTSVTKLAYWDLAYNLANVFLFFLYPHYRWHAIYHPLWEYAGWIKRLVLRPWNKKKRQAMLGRVYREAREYYLFPLQLATDYQLREHSPFSDQLDAVRLVVRSFAKHAPDDRVLIFKIHPLDNALVPWPKRIHEIAKEYDVARRVLCFEGGKLNKFLDNSSGVITINSTVGASAIVRGRPLVVLGTAIFDIPGLTFQHGIDRFWNEATPPDTRLARQYMRALAGTIQVKGGFYSEAAIAAAVPIIARRIEERAVNMPDAFVDPPPRLYWKKLDTSETKRQESLEGAAQ